MPDDILGHSKAINPDLVFYDMFTGQKNFLLAICASLLYAGDFLTIDDSIASAQLILDKIAKKEGQ